MYIIDYKYTYINILKICSTGIFTLFLLHNGDLNNDCVLKHIKYKWWYIWKQLSIIHWALCNVKLTVGAITCTTCYYTLFQITPVFLLFLDCVYQLTVQYPSSFEFSEIYLVTLWDSCVTGLFKEFIFDSNRERGTEKKSRYTDVNAQRSAQ